MPQNKNLTQIRLTEGRFGKRNGYVHEREAAAAGKRRKGGGRKPACDAEFAAALRKTWAFSWHRCGKILASFMREQVRHLEGPFENPGWRKG